MAQTVKYVDLTRSYIPLDPNSFPDGLHIADLKEENRIPVMPIDGKNFLPTAYGYKSYFGVEKSLEVAALTERVDMILLFQNNERNNFLIALCDSGIWYKAGAVSGAWTQAVVLPHNRSDPLIHYEWSFAVLNDILYCYRENGANYYTIESQVAAPGILVATSTPSFLNMEAQKGIFRAGNRLGFWDSADSIAWSTLDDKSDFTPDLETLAGFATFDQIVGRIVLCKAHGDGFLVYSTKSILHIQKSSSSLYMWDPSVVLHDTGIAYPEQVTSAIPDTTQFAYTNTGMYKIQSGQAEVLIPEITDFFKLQETPKYLHILEGRYLFIQTINPSYVTGFPQVTEEVIPPAVLPIGATNLQELYALTQTDPPQLSQQGFLDLVQQGTFTTVYVPPIFEA